MDTRAATRAELRESGYQPRSIRQELSANLIAHLRSGTPIFPGIHGYDDTVLPQFENAILAGHDILLLGERGQAKTRLARSLVHLLDEIVPVIAGSETMDDPFAPVSSFGSRTVAQLGDQTPITWVAREDRFAEKLATPDTTIADLIGEIDPIKVAEGRYLSNEEVLAFGLIPRTNRGIFNLNELPDLPERIQVGLLNILEESDVQIRGFQVRLPLDVLVVASANPEDYTNRGRIITPLKDRFGSQIRTHYPQSLQEELRIVDQEYRGTDIEGITVRVPEYMRQLIAEISRIARTSQDISQRSGVSVRMTIANYEAIIANAQRRAIVMGESLAVPRMSDLHALTASMMGKIEFETFDDAEDARVVDRVLAEAVRRVGLSHLDPELLDGIQRSVEQREGVAVTERTRAEEIAGLAPLPDMPAADAASLVEFALEFLYRERRIDKIEATSGTAFRSNQSAIR